MKNLFLPLGILFGITFFSNLLWAAPKVHINYNYTLGDSDIAKATGTVRLGETMETHHDHGDIESIISVVPRWNPSKDKNNITLDIHIQNYRDGELISESKPQFKTIPGKQAMTSKVSDDPNQTFKLSIRPQFVK